MSWISMYLRSTILDTMKVLLLNGDDFSAWEHEQRCPKPRNGRHLKLVVPDLLHCQGAT